MRSFRKEKILPALIVAFVVEGIFVSFVPTRVVPIYGAIKTVSYIEAWGVIVYVLKAGIDVHPDTLNLNSNGQWITVRITLPEGYSVGDITPDTVKIGDVPLVWSKIQKQIFIAKFDRASVQRTLTGLPDYEESNKLQDLILTVTGQLSNGQLFEGSDTIKVITKN